MLYKTTTFYTCEYTGNHNKEASPDLGQFINASTQETNSQQHPPKKKRRFTKPGAFRLAELFETTDVLKNSFLEISLKLDIIERSAKRCVAVDIENGFITKNKTQYKCWKYKTLLSGINEYHLTEKGRKYLNRSSDDSKTPPSSNNSSKEEYIAKSTAPENISSKLNAEEKALLKKHGFEKLITGAPKSWFKDFPLLKKCLKLANQKQARGFKIKNPWGFITTLLEQEGDGYRKKIAKEVSKKIANDLPPQTPYEKDALLALQSLQPKGLDTSPTALQHLLRKAQNRHHRSRKIPRVEQASKIPQWNALMASWTT